MFKLTYRKSGNRIRTKGHLLSSLTVALALVPEAVAFAINASVSTIIGLYADFIVYLRRKTAAKFSARKTAQARNPSLSLWALPGWVTEDLPYRINVESRFLHCRIENSFQTQTSKRSNCSIEATSIFMILWVRFQTGVEWLLCLDLSYTNLE